MSILGEFYRRHVYAAGQSWALSQDLNREEKDAFWWLSAIVFLTKIGLHLADIIITNIAFHDTFKAHGNPSFIAWATVLLCLGWGSWLMDLFRRSTLKLLRRQSLYRAIRLVVAISFTFWSRHFPTAGKTGVAVQLMKGAACSFVAVLLSHLKELGKYWASRKFAEKYKLLPFRLDYKLIHHEGTQASVEERNEAQRRFEDGAPWPESRQTAWHVPTHMIDFPSKKLKFLRTKEDTVREGNLLQVSRADTLDEIFSRCYCCLNGEPASRAIALVDPESKKSISRMRRWRENRVSFLRKRPHSHFGDVTKLSPGSVSELRPHRLCHKCEIMCEKSRRIKGLKAIGFSFDPSIMKVCADDCFDHYATPGELATSSKEGCEEPGELGRTGCHLCKLIWATLSQDQQRKLLSVDAALEAALQDELDRVSEAESSEVRSRYHGQRAISIKIEGHASGYSWSAGVIPLHIGPFARIIPHFGGTRIAKRWIAKRTATRLISVNKDLAPDLRNEQAGAIIIAVQPPLGGKLGNEGPLVLPISNSTKSTLTMDLIKKCLQVHEHCGKPTSHSELPMNLTEDLGIDNTGAALQPDSYPLLNQAQNRSQQMLPQSRGLPTRLIDVSGPDSSIFRVCNSDTLVKNHGEVSFLALSHCWGSGVSSTLTEHNISEMYSGSSIGDLAQTFQDAIYVTRSLSFSYLWIDSLCIIQRDNSHDEDNAWRADWAKEASLMRDVYANAACVIVALASWDSSESFFVDQNSLAMHPCLIDVWNPTYFPSKPGSELGIYAWPDFRFMETAEQDIRYSRIRSRGWCFQEEYLAKKIVWFGPNQVFFTCQPGQDRTNHQVTSQASVYPLTSDFSLRHDINTEESKKEKPKPSINQYRPTKFDVWLKENNSLGFRMRWWDAINDYTARFLTKASDRSTAVEGLSGYFHDQLGHFEQDPSPYIHGLWGGPHLPSSLLWFVYGPSSRPSDAAARGPSFSWTSVNRVIRQDSFFASTATCGLDIIDVVASPNISSTNPETTVAPCQAPYIHLKGKIAPARWNKNTETHGPRYYVGHATRMKYVDTPADLAQFVPWNKDPTFGPEIVNLANLDEQNIGIFLPDTTEDLPDEIFCLRIVVEAEDLAVKEDFGVPFATRGLVLVKANEGAAVGPKEDNVYRRVGYFELEKKHADMGGLTFPDFTTGAMSLRMEGLPVRRPWPNIDSWGFFSDVRSTELWII